MSTDLGQPVEVTDDQIRALRHDNAHRRIRSRRWQAAAVCVAVLAATAGSGAAMLADPPPERGSALRTVADPAISAFADHITTSPYDDTHGRYQYAEYLGAQREHGSTLSIVRARFWTAADASGASIFDESTVPLVSFRPTDLLTQGWQNTTHQGIQRAALPDALGLELACPPGTVLGDRLSHTPDPGADPGNLARFATSVYLGPGLRLDCRRALLNGLALLDGPVWRGPATDILGREGFAIDVPAFGKTTRLVFDRAGMLLSAAEASTWNTDTDSHPGIYLYMILIDTERTDYGWPDDQITQRPTPSTSPVQQSTPDPKPSTVASTGDEPMAPRGGRHA